MEQVGNNVGMRTLSWLREFGNTTTQRAMTNLFYLGTIPWLIFSIVFGRHM